MWLPLIAIKGNDLVPTPHSADTCCFKNLIETIRRRASCFVSFIRPSNFPASGLGEQRCTHDDRIRIEFLNKHLRILLGASHRRKGWWSFNFTQINEAQIDSFSSFVLQVLIHLTGYFQKRKSFLMDHFDGFDL